MDKMYKQDFGDKFNGKEWFKDKYKLGLAFPNLPYYIDGDVKLTISHVILKYICQKYRPEYLGIDENEKMRVEMIGANVYDTFYSFAITYLNPNYEESIPVQLFFLKPRLKIIAGLLQQTRFVCANHVTWVDFYVYEALQLLERAVPGVIDEISPVFSRFRGEMQALEGVRECENRGRPARFLANVAYAKL